MSYIRRKIDDSHKVIFYLASILCVTFVISLLMNSNLNSKSSSYSDSSASQMESLDLLGDSNLITGDVVYSKTVGRATIFCEDSDETNNDGGKNIFKKGTASYYSITKLSGGKTRTSSKSLLPDYCFNTGVVREYYCNPTTSKIVKADIACENGCVDGACKSVVKEKSIMSGETQYYSEEGVLLDSYTPGSIEVTNYLVSNDGRVILYFNGINTRGLRVGEKTKITYYSSHPSFQNTPYNGMRTLEITIKNLTYVANTVEVFFDFKILDQITTFEHPIAYFDIADYIANNEDKGYQSIHGFDFTISSSLYQNNSQNETTDIINENLMLLSINDVLTGPLQEKTYYSSDELRAIGVESFYIDEILVNDEESYLMFYLTTISNPYDLSEYPSFLYDREIENFDVTLVVGEKAPSNEVVEAINLQASFQTSNGAKLDSDITNLNQNIISIGSPCTNTISARLAGNPANCAEGLSPGVGKIKLYKNGEYANLVVEGYSAKDLSNAINVLINYWDYSLSGTEFIVKSSYSLIDGETKHYKEDGTLIDAQNSEIEITALIISNDGRARLAVNGIISKSLSTGGKEIFSYGQDKSIEVSIISIERDEVVGENNLELNQRSSVIPGSVTFDFQVLPTPKTNPTPSSRIEIVDIYRDGDSKKYTVSGKDYEVVSIFVGNENPHSTKLSINGIITPHLQANSVFSSKELSSFGIKSIIIGDILINYRGALFDFSLDLFDCYDSDGGENYFVRGFTDGISNNQGFINDTCVTADTLNGCEGMGCLLLEGFCDEQQNVRNSYTGCPYGCEDGACKSSPVCGNKVCEVGETQSNCASDCIVSSTCIDSDNGNIPTTKGYLNYPSWTPNTPDVCGVKTNDGNYDHKATCSGPDCYLIELYCSDDAPQRDFVSCPNGCNDGVCGSDVVGSCSESDRGQNYNLKGSLIFNNQLIGEDYCNEKGELTELYCISDNTGYTSVDFTCPGFCENGACITNFCSDTDNGVNKEVQGTSRNSIDTSDLKQNRVEVDACIQKSRSLLVSLQDIFSFLPFIPSYTPNYVDSCVAGKNCYVSDYYCNEDLTLSFVEEACPFGCSNGACVTNSVCGNGIVEFGEICDGNNLQGNTCNSIDSAWNGTLTCHSDCTAYNSDSCSLLGVGPKVLSPATDSFVYVGSNLVVSWNNFLKSSSSPTVNAYLYKHALPVNGYNNYIFSGVYCSTSGLTCNLSLPSNLSAGIYDVRLEYLSTSGSGVSAFGNVFNIVALPVCGNNICEASEKNYEDGAPYYCLNDCYTQEDQSINIFSNYSLNVSNFYLEFQISPTVEFSAGEYYPGAADVSVTLSGPNGDVSSSLSPITKAFCTLPGLTGECFRIGSNGLASGTHNYVIKLKEPKSGAIAWQTNRKAFVVSNAVPSSTPFFISGETVQTYTRGDSNIKFRFSSSLAPSVCRYHWEPSQSWSSKISNGLVYSGNDVSLQILATNPESQYTRYFQCQLPSGDLSDEFKVVLNIN